VGMLLRILFAVVLVAATWNPTGWSYVQWALIDTSTFDATKIYKVGETARAPDFSMGIENVKECKVPYYFKPKKGNVKLMGLAGMSPRGKIAGKYDLSIVSPEENSYPFCPEQVMPRRKTRPTSAEPKAAFIAAAKAAGADEDEKRWEARLKAVAKLPPKPVKKGSAHRGSTR